MESKEEGVRSSTSYGANWPGVNHANGDPLPQIPYIQPTGLWPVVNDFHFTVEPGPPSAVHRAQALANKIDMLLVLRYSTDTRWNAQLGEGHVEGQFTPEQACEELLQHLLALGAVSGTE